MNKKFYWITIGVSILLIIPAFIWDFNYLTVLASVGCSGLAAAIMALIVECAAEKREKVRLHKARKIYFNKLNSELTMMLESFLWFDERMGDDLLDWSKPISKYLSLSFYIWAQQNTKEKDIQFEEVNSLLGDIAEKYSYDNQKNMKQDKLLKVQKMFNILAHGGTYLLHEVKELEKNKLMLDAENFIALNEIDLLMFNIPLAIDIMSKTDKNYTLAIQLLFQSLEIIRKVGGYNGDLKIGMHALFSLSEF